MACVGRSVAAQGFESAPAGAIFGVAKGGTRDRLDVTAALSEAYDREPPPDLRPRIQNGALPGGFSSMMTAAAEYERSRRRADVTGQVFTALQYYPSLGEVVVLTHNAGVGAKVALPARSSLELTQTVAYSPTDLYRLFPTMEVPGVGGALPSSPDYRVDEFRSLSYVTRVSVASGSSRGNQIRAAAERTATDFEGDADRRDLETFTGAMAFAHGVGRTGTLSLEYQYREGEYGYGRTAEHKVGISANYSPALSRTRRVQLRLTLSPSAIDVPDLTAGIEAAGTLYRMEAEGSAEYPFSRTWTIRGAYRRGLEYIPVLRQPVFQDAVRVETAGLVRERVDVSASAGKVAGESILQRENQLLDTYTGTIRARYSLNRSVAIYGQYLYYYYDLRGQAGLAPDLPPRFEQHGLRLGLMLWARPVSR